MNSAVVSLCAVLSLSAGQAVSLAGATNDLPPFKEVYDLIHAHAAGLTDGELDQAAVRGLISALGPKVALIDDNAGGSSAKDSLVKTNLYGNRIAYLRIARVGGDLADAVRDGCRAMAGTNQLNGVVLDLRYADGIDYAAAAATADLFVKKEQPLLDWGTGMAKSKEKSEVLATPVAVLVNEQTAGAAEALAAILRSAGVGLILGGRTAGAAFTAEEFPLANGQRLRIATAAVRLGDGTQLSSALKPDLAVSVSAANQKAFYANAYSMPESTNLLAGGGLSRTNAANGTNRSPRHVLFNEAELVREHRAGLNSDGAPEEPFENANAAGQSARGEEAARPAVQDPVLARALDLLTGLAVVRQSRT
jgi:carboxyl-terminal processing protease